MKKIAIFYSKTGGGHLSLAKATADAINTYYPGKFQILLYDPHYPIYAKAYERLSTDLQQLWKTGYQATSHPQISDLVHKLVTPTVVNKLAKYIQTEQPDIVVSNHVFITVELMLALKKANSKAKTAIYYADPFSLHPAWLTSKNADLYLSPTHEATITALSFGIPPEKIKTVGWLTRSSFFTKPLPRDTVLKVIGLDPTKLIVFVGGSGQGGGKIYEFCYLATKVPHITQSSQFIINTGINPNLISKVTKLIQRFPRLFFLAPYLQNPLNFMSASNIMVGKAGPNYLFEAIHLGKPFLATGCMPGQEEGNLEFIKKYDLGWVETDPQKSLEIIEQVLTNPQLLKTKASNLKSISRSHTSSAKNVARELNWLIDH